MRNRVVIICPSTDLSSSLERVLRDSGCNPETVNQYPAGSNLPTPVSAQSAGAAVLIDAASESQALRLLWRLRTGLLHSREVSLDNVHILVNRSSCWGGINKSTLEQIVGLPVEWVVDTEFASACPDALEAELVEESVVLSGRPKESAVRGTAGEALGDRIAEPRRQVTGIIPHSHAANGPSIAEAKSAPGKAELGEAESVTELASALLDATRTPLQSLERNWFAQLEAFQSRTNERFDAIEKVRTSVAHFEVAAIEVLREAPRGEESRAQRIENRTNNCFEEIESLRTAVSGQLQDVAASLEQIRVDMAKQDKMMCDLRHAEDRRAQAAEQLTKLCGEIRDSIGLLTTTSQPASIEAQSASAT